MGLIFLDIESTQLPSPTKNIAGDHNRPTDCKSYITNGHKFTHFIFAMASNPMTLQNMPDPDGVYSAMSQNSTSPTYVKNPNICGSNRDIIPASDYGPQKRHDFFGRRLPKNVPDFIICLPTLIFYPFQVGNFPKRA